MTPFKMWRGIKNTRRENKVNLISIRFQTAVRITVPKESHNSFVGLRKI